MSDATFPAFPTLLPKPLDERRLRLLERARTHAADFATRAAGHDRDNTFPMENYEAMKESGYAHMTLPKDLGGEDVNLLELSACQEQLAQGCAGTAIGVNMHIFVLGSLLFDRESADDERKAQLDVMLQGLGQSKMIMSGSFSERGVPGAYQLPQTKAVKVEGGWRVNGTKAYNSNLPASDMVGALVHLQGDGVADDQFAMIGIPKATEGVIPGDESSWDVLGVRASGSWDVTFKDVFVSDEMMPAPQSGSSFFANMSAFGAWFNITVSAVYLGVAQAAVDWATNYMKTRIPPTEERPLSHMPGMQYQLAEMIALNEASRAIIRTSAEDWMARPWGPEETGFKGGICKYIATNNHVKVVDIAMDIAGGPGIFSSFGLERLYRDVRASKAHPPADMMALEAIAKFHLGIPRDFKPRWG